MIKKLEKHLEASKHSLVGDWIKNNSSYDGSICNILNMVEDTVRYWDARWNGLFIEFKKGNSIWLDLVRYSEILLKTTPESSVDSFTLFFIPNKEKNKIVEIIGVSTEDIIRHVGLSKSIASELVALKCTVPRSLNAQASLTKKDVRNISTFVVSIT